MPPNIPQTPHSHTLPHATCHHHCKQQYHSHKTTNWDHGSALWSSASFSVMAIPSASSSLLRLRAASHQ